MFVAVLPHEFGSLCVSSNHRNVTKITTATRFRLSTAQMSVIWPGSAF
jgi:hypothetical protein